jgi:hypothetical protein
MAARIALAAAMGIEATAASQAAALEDLTLPSDSLLDKGAPVAARATEALPEPEPTPQDPQLARTQQPLASSTSTTLCTSGFSSSSSFAKVSLALGNAGADAT